MTFSIILFGTFFPMYIGADDNQINHLFKNYKNGTAYNVAFQHETLIEARKVKKMRVQCHSAGMTDQTGRKGYVCNGLEIVMSDDEKIEVNKEEEIRKEGLDFEEIAKKNAETKKKESEERRKANKSVLKGYGIKK